MNHPIQTLEEDDQGVIRFKENKIVRYLLDNGGIDLNQIARQHFSNDDRNQFAQLIGYSVDGYASLSYSSKDIIAAADLAETFDKSMVMDMRDAQIATLTSELDNLRAVIKKLAVDLFKIHPDDLTS